jgi:hypothetical protein
LLNLSPGVGCMSDYSKITVLCEDRQQEVFARYFLTSLGIHPRRIYYDICPSGKQAGEQYVRENYPKNVISYRRIAHNIEAGLVVLTDADIMRVEQRLRTLDAALANSEVNSRKPTERIGIFIPKRNMETWIYFIRGDEVNENDIYPHLDKAGEYKSAIETFARNRNQTPFDGLLPSMQMACSELNRIISD